MIKRGSRHKDQNGTIDTWYLFGGLIYILHYIRPQPNLARWYQIGIAYKVIWFENRYGNWRIML